MDTSWYGLWLWWSFGLYKDEIIIVALMAKPRNLLGSSSRKANWRRWTRSGPDSNFSSLVIFHHFLIFYLSFTSLRLSWRWCCMTLVSHQIPWNSRRWPSTSSGPTYLPLKLTEITIDMSTPSILRYFHLLITSIFIALLAYSILISALMLKITFKFVCHWSWLK